jgi:glycosyltransferase involved in cell wall biosynthesis
MIFVCLPAWNEAPTVGLLLWKVRQLFTNFSRDYQFLVVNDGSSDATEEVLAPYTRALPLTLVTHRRRRGYGPSLEALLRLAAERTDRPRRDMAVVLQADFSDSPDDLPDLVKRIEGGADIALPDRRAAKGRPVPIARRLTERVVHPLMGLPFSGDPVGTLRAYRLVTIQRLLREVGDERFITRNGWAADVELLARLAPHARRIDAVPLDAERVPADVRPSRHRPVRSLWGAGTAALALRSVARRAVSTADDAAPPPAAAEPAGAPADRKSGRRPRRRGRGRRGPRRDQGGVPKSSGA